jgi:hypothetical protein
VTGRAWKSVWKEAVSAAIGKMKSRRTDTRKRLDQVTDAHKTSLASLLAAFADGKIDDGTFNGELADEKRILLANLLASGVAKKGAQDATAAFFRTIERAARGER